MKLDRYGIQIKNHNPRKNCFVVQGQIWTLKLLFPLYCNEKFRLWVTVSKKIEGPGYKEIEEKYPLTIDKTNRVTKASKLNRIKILATKLN